MEKTRRELLMELKPEHAQLAIQNVLNEEDSEYLDSIGMTQDLRMLLNMVFIWHETPEGHDFWKAIEDEIIEGTYHDTQHNLDGDNGEE
jgi:hypothetical protein